MTADALASYLAPTDEDRRNAFAAAAKRLDTVPGYVEIDFSAGLVLEARIRASVKASDDRGTITSQRPAFLPR